MSIAAVTLLVSAVFYGFLSSYHNSANMVATPIASRAIKPRTALFLAAVGTFLGPLFFGVAVAETIGTDITDPENITIPVVIAGTLATVIWGLFTWWRGIPSSSSHAIIGGLVGAVIVSTGLQAIKLEGLSRIALALLISPILGLLAGYILMKVTIFLAHGASPNINRLFQRSQVFSSFGLALSSGTNDAQKMMGLITMGLVAENIIPSFTVPTWVILLSAVTTALGTGLGGWRLIRTLGYRIYRIRPVHSFVSQISGASVILGASVSGAPVSTTQVISSSIMGAGSAERLSKVRWKVAYEMLSAWLLTIPVSSLLAAILYFPLDAILSIGRR